MTVRRVTTFTAGALLFAGGLCLRASDEGACPPVDPQPSSAALRIAIDPHTGALAAAAGVPAAPSPAVQHPPLAGVRLPSGAVRVDLKGRYRMAVTAHRDAAGAMTTACVPAGEPTEPTRAEVAHAE